MSYLNTGTAQAAVGFGTGAGCGCGGFCGSTGFGDPPSTAEGRLREMAKWPDDAHAAWKKLDARSRDLVVVQMAAKYGSEFARQFLASVGKRNRRDMVEHYYGPDVGPTPATLKGRGYKLAQKDSVHEWWVHPTGERVMRNYTVASRSTMLPRSAACRDIDTLTDSICSNADKICKLAGELNDEKSRAACQRARASCIEARKNSQSCGPSQKGGGSQSRIPDRPARVPSLGGVGQFQLMDAATCPPAGFTMAQATAAVRRSIAVAVGILKTAASRLDSVEQKRVSGQPRNDQDTDTARLFLFFFGHDPNKPISGAVTSGVNVAYRLRAAAMALVKRGIHYRCACPGAPAGRRGQGAHQAIEIDLCNAFWTLDPHVRADAETFRAGIILHETLHLIFRDMGDAGAQRANAHCYEAFAMRAAGHAADPSDVRRCRPDLFP